MKLRYQMRGLGVGIIVTALLMGVALDDGRPLSDAEIKLLAAELGMVDGDSLKLSDVQQSSGAGDFREEIDTQQREQEPMSSPTTEPTASPTAEPTVGPATESTEAPTTEPTTTPTVEPTEKPTPEPTLEPTKEPTREVEDEVPAVITIVVKSGANSYSVSKLLAEAGLVENANGYDKFLCSNGYAERIQVGTFEIPMGSSEQEIAKIITKTR